MNERLKIVWHDAKLERPDSSQEVLVTWMSPYGRRYGSVNYSKKYNRFNMFDSLNPDEVDVYADVDYWAYLPEYNKPYEAENEL